MIAPRRRVREQAPEQEGLTTMTRGNVRQMAIDVICKTRPRGGAVDYKTRAVHDVYGEHVFNDRVRRERLS